MENQIVIKNSVIRTFFYAVLCIIMAVASVYMLLNANSSLFIFFAILGIIFFGFGGFFLFYKAFNPSAYITLTTNGIILNDKSLIEWKNISRLDLVDVAMTIQGKSMTLIGIDLVDRNRFLQTVQPAWKQNVSNNLLNYNTKNTGFPLHINSSVTRYDVGQLYQIIKENWEKYR